MIHSYTSNIYIQRCLYTCIFKLLNSISILFSILPLTTLLRIFFYFFHRIISRFRILWKIVHLLVVDGVKPVHMISRILCDFVVDRVWLFYDPYDPWYTIYSENEHIFVFKLAIIKRLLWHFEAQFGTVKSHLESQVLQEQGWA